MGRFSRDRLMDVFGATANFSGESPNPKLARIRAIHVTPGVYKAYIRLYETSLDLAQSLRQVIDDGEHQLAMEEASFAGHDLPDIVDFENDLAAYNSFLRSFDPFSTSVNRRGEISLPLNTAISFGNLVRYNCFMLSRVLSGCFDTDYFRHFGTLKASGIPYAGPTALQQTFGVLTYMHQTRHAYDREISLRQPPSLSV